MKIRKITFGNHPILGNLSLDFTSPDGKVINTIIIAGENGVGKSLLLNSIFEFSSFNVPHNKSEETRVFEIEISNLEFLLLQKSERIKQNFTSSFGNNIFRIHFSYNNPGHPTQINIQYLTANGYVQILPHNIFNQHDTHQILKLIFSDVEINFSPTREINTVTSTNIDSQDTHSKRSNLNLATEITQLLVDIQSLDALDFTEWARNNIGSQIDDSKIDTRIKRFTAAYDFMFPAKKYKRIATMEGRKEVIFEENGKEMTIGKLSSGEKQVVFRGSFLLRDKESAKGALILIDEPEISLHPNWQLKIMSFFKKLFTNAEGEQTSQLIISTHSPFIIHNANRKDDKVIVIQKDDKGIITVSNHPKFLTWSVEKIIQEAFKISHVLSLDKTTVFLEGETDEKYYNKCLALFGKNSSQIECKWIGRINDKGNAENTGDTALNQAKTFFTANMEQIRSKIVLLYDSDTNKPEEVIENLVIKKMRINDQNQIFKVGVENLLILIPEIDTSQFYKEHVKKDNYGAESIIRELNKTKLCDFICDTLDIDKQKIVLANVHKEIERLLNNSG